MNSSVHEKYLKDLQNALCAIARDRGFDNPELQAQIAKNRLLRAIEGHQSRIAADLHYAKFIQPWVRENERPEHWLCYLVRLTSNRRGIGRLRGSRPLSRSGATEDAERIQSQTQLTPVELRAFQILKGKRARPRSRVHPIERRAILLAKAVEADWFSRAHHPGRPKGRWRRKSNNHDDGSFDALKPLLTITDVILLTAPIIQQFAASAISRPSAAFDALCHAVCAHSAFIKRETHRVLQISPDAVHQALRRARPELTRRTAAPSGESGSGR